LARYFLSPGFVGEPIETKSWVGVCKGRFEETGVFTRRIADKYGEADQGQAVSRQEVVGGQLAKAVEWIHVAS
jgi:hypothetical protein